jgi:hypothetical protein
VINDRLRYGIWVTALICLEFRMIQFEAYNWNDADLDRLVNDDEFWSSLGS